MKRGGKAHNRGGMLYQRSGSKFWWCQYYAPGRRKPVRESTGEVTESKAAQFLRKKLGAIANDAFIAPQIEKGTRLSDLQRTVEQDYKARGRRSVRQLGVCFKRLREYFIGDPLVRALTSDMITGYVASQRETQPRSNGRTYARAVATTNRDLAALKHGLRLLVEAGKLARIPKIVLTPENNVRRGFVTREQFDRLVTKLPEDLRDPLSFAYLSAWRIGEVRSLRREDIIGNEIQLRAENSKNGEARTLPLSGELLEVVKRGLAAGSEFVFARANGMQLRAFRKPWVRACKAAHLDGLRVHDLRRSAIRDLVRATGSETVVMSISGHKTVSTFRRYNVTDSRDKLEALRRRDEYHANQPAEQVVAFPTARSQGRSQ